MRIETVKIKNFRSYKGEAIFKLNDLTAFVGKNDVGKSTILEALDVFINDGKGVVKIDNDDFNKDAIKDGDGVLTISVVFSDLPKEVIIDTSYPTTLESEYLFNSDNNLEIIKKYKQSKAKTLIALKPTVFIKANHPTNPKCENLLIKTRADLVKIYKEIGSESVDKRKKAEIRKAIWNHYSDDLQLKITEVEVSKEDAADVYSNLKEHFPAYNLFQSDRTNNDGDDEVQDPLKIAVRNTLKEEDILKDLKKISLDVQNILQNVADRTLAKLHEIDSEIAKSLNPKIPEFDQLKWADVFKIVSISGEEDIPLNKRGSGVRRLVLLSFLKAEAEKIKDERKIKNVIYAYEEPETSQHPEYQKILVESLKEISNSKNYQVLLTTHSPSVVELLDINIIIPIIGVKNKVFPDMKKEILENKSLNELIYIVFDSPTIAYHNELFNHICSEKLLDIFEGEQTNKEDYYNVKKKKTENISVSMKIRHQSHYPIKNPNPMFTEEDLINSIKVMREFLTKHKSEYK